MAPGISPQQQSDCMLTYEKITKLLTWFMTSVKQFTDELMVLTVSFQIFFSAAWCSWYEIWSHLE